MYGKQTDFTATAAAVFVKRDVGAEDGGKKKRFKWNKIVVFWNFLPYSTLNIIVGIY